MTIAEEFSDEGHSGKNIKGRPEFVRMMEKIESGEDGVEYVFVFKLSRFGRNAADVLNSLLQRRYDEQCDKAEAIETQIDEINTQMLSIRQEKISADNVYQLLLSFDKLYNTFTEVEQRDFMQKMIIFHKKVILSGGGVKPLRLFGGKG